MDRRRFITEQLQRAAVLGSAAWSVPFTSAHGKSQPAMPQPLGVLEDVDHYELTHALRDGRKPMPTEASEECDVAIVGGGMSGLIAAHRLGARKLVVLEKEPEPGGNSRSREVAGCRYALGAFLSQGPIPPFTEFFKSTAAPFIPLQGHDHALHDAGRTVRDPLGAGIDQLPWPKADRQALRAAVTRLKPLGDPKDGLVFPIENGSAALRDYDKRTLWQQYEADKLPPRVRQLFDMLIAARVSDNGENLSAWVGTHLLANLLVPVYTMRGGHGAFSAQLAAELQAKQPQALRCGFTVLRVQPQGADQVLVTGIDAQGQLRAIGARCAVLGMAKHFAKHVVPGLREQRAEAYSALHYNAYVVGQVHLKRPIDAAYETGLMGAKRTPFIVAPDALPGNQRTDGGGLRTVYAPFPRVAGRASLLAADAQQLAAEIAADLQRLSPAYAGAIDRIVLHRWGHPMLTATPGMGGALAKVSEPEGRIVFAHGDNLGITGLYSAVWAGMSAEADAEVILS